MAKFYIQKNTTALLKQLGLPYTCVINSTMDLIKDPATLGIYIYLQSKPQNWKIQEEELMKRFGRGRDFIRERLKQLREIGLLVAKTKRTEKGHITGWDIILYSHLPSQLKNKPESKSPQNEADKTDKTQEDDQEAKEQENQNKEKPIKPDTSVMRENPTHIKERDLLSVKKETTTTDEVVLTSKNLDEELSELREEYMPNDSREPEEFIKQCKWHLEKGDAKKYNLSQRIAGLKKLITTRRFETPAGYKVKNKATSIAQELLEASYQHYYNSAIEREMRAKGYKSKSFDQWKAEAA